MLSGLIQAVFEDVKSTVTLMVALFLGVLLLGYLFTTFGDPYGIGESFRKAILLVLAIPSGIGILAYLITKLR